MNYYAESTWKNYDPEQQANLRIAKLLSLFPEDVHTILDAGCGNGIITNKLVDKYQVTGLDISPAALQYVKCPTVQAPITDIPFPDRSFETVICNEVLEHLDNSALQKAVQELKRVASKYIIISVPHREQLDKHYCKCANCGFTEHTYGHLQSFSENTLNALLVPEFSLTAQEIFGPQNRDFIPFLLYIKQHWLKQWFNPPSGTICSNCGKNEFLNKKSLFTKAINFCNNMSTKPRPYWFMGLFVRQED